VALLPDLKLGGLLDVTPLLNIVLLAKEIFEGVARPRDILIVVLSTLFYTFAAITVAARIFGAEAVLYSDQGHWSDLFRRPKIERQMPTLSAGLLCLAVMFPAFFCISGGMFQLDLPIKSKLLLVVPVSFLLFVGIPYLSARMSNVNLRSAFQLRPTNLRFWLGALLLGLSLWPFVMELMFQMQHLGLTSLSAKAREALAEQMKQLPELPPLLVLLAYAVTPAVVEELFFRGYLFNALAAGNRPRNAIIISAVLFGIFHVLVHDSLMLERAVPTTLLGLILGWVRWRSGSVWPGMLLHVGHNSLVISIAFMPQFYERLGLVAGDSLETVHVSILVLAGAGAVVVVGALLIGAGKKT
jgi:ABC-2 type transport system permease protein/sodium transport system permease protein